MAAPVRSIGLRFHIVPRTYISDASLIAQHNYLRAAVDGRAIFRARRYRSARTQLGVNNFARAIGMQRASDAANHARDLSFLSGERALARQQHRGEKPEDERAAGDPADSGKKQDHRGEQTAVRAQQVPHSAEPTKKGG